MSGTPSTAERLAQLVEEVSGNVIGDLQLPLLEAIGSRRARERGFSDLERYVSALARGAMADEWRQLLPLVTIKESFFFRTPEHFRVIASLALPELARARQATRRLRAWSAGCARGEEPASLAIALAEAPVLVGWDWSVLATDVDEVALADARSGLYRERALAQTPDRIRRAHFAKKGGLFELTSPILRMIDYRTLNLIHEPLDLPEYSYDIIMLRNVLIYFRPESQRRVARALARLLAPDGYLFVGPSETLWQLTDDLRPVDLGDCFCYRHRQAAPPPVAVLPVLPGCRHDPADFVPESAPTRPIGTTERCAEGGPLAEAVAVLSQGDLGNARPAIAALLGAAPADPSAHALEGLVNDLGGDLDAALAAYRAALFLDPHLFQVRLLLADCLRRGGAGGRAATEYRGVLRDVDSGRAAKLPFAAALALPGREAARGRAAHALAGMSTPTL